MYYHTIYLVAQLLKKKKRFGLQVNANHLDKVAFLVSFFSKTYLLMMRA